VSRRPFALVAAAVTAASLAASCGGGTTSINLFSTNWTDDRGVSMENVRARLGGAKPTPGADVVVGVAGNADKIIGLPLGGGPRWTFAHTLDSRPLVAGAVVVGSGGGELFALDALKGTKLWSRPTGGLAAYGIGDDGGVTVIALAGATGKGAALLAITHDGAVVRQIETDKLLGTPAVVSRIAFVPWSSQYVSAIDLSNGDEVGRVVLREKTSRAWTEGNSLYFGEVGIFRFDAHIKDASRGQATHVALPVRELPGAPVLMQPGGERLSPVAGATDRIRLFARPSGGDPLTIEDDRYFATYFRIVMGFDAHRGNLSWVHLHDHDIVGGDAAKSSLVLCDELGKIVILEATTGAAAGQLDLGEPIKSCTVQVETFAARGGERPGSLAAQIATSLESNEAQLATANRFLLRELATLEDEAATKTLVDLAQSPRAAPPLVADAREALATRRNGARFMVEALHKHFDFLKDELRSPPVGPMAQALAAMKETSAAPVLAEHLLDPADTEDDVKQAAAALVVLGGPAQVPHARHFFAMYRATAEGEDMTAAVVSAGQVLLKYGGKDGRALVDFALSDPHTIEAAKERLEVTLQQVELEQGGGGKPEPPKNEKQPDKADPKGGPKTDPKK
jgi:outer membrane protein assembly factor BamB